MSLSDGIGSQSVVKKVDLQVDQVIADLAARWRVIDTPRGSLDVYADVRYTNMYQAFAIQPNNDRIGVVAERLATAGAAGIDPELPIAPLEAGEVTRLAKAIERIGETRRAAGPGETRRDCPQDPTGALRPK